MQLKKSDRRVIVVLLVCATLATIPVLMKGFGAVMGVLWLLSLAGVAIFHLALRKGYGTDGFLLAYLVSKGAENGKSAQEVYSRGYVVSAIMVVLIPILYVWAK